MHAKFPVTVHMFFLRGNKILLMRRYQTGYMDGHYSVPAGHLDGNEPVRLAAVREAQEEIGVRVDPAEVRFAGVFHRSEGDERVDFFVHVQSWNGEPVNAEPEKCDEIRWRGYRRSAGEYDPLHPAGDREFPGGCAVRGVWLGEKNLNTKVTKYTTEEKGNISFFIIEKPSCP